jgi:hypothetical protein
MNTTALGRRAVDSFDAAADLASDGRAGLTFTEPVQYRQYAHQHAHDCINFRDTRNLRWVSGRQLTGEDLNSYGC